MKTLETLFFDQLADIYDAETRLIKALPNMAKAATQDELRRAFENHFEETRGHAEKVEAVFRAFGRSAKAKKCPAMDGLIKEADHLAAENKGFPAINAALIAAAQKVEHYEIASYGCLRAWADQLGNDQAMDLLDEILDQEKAADRKLTELAQERCNESARGASPDEEDESDDRLNGGARRGRTVTMRASAS
jgi:ferritin-like metal-binding protein YciE